MGPALGVRTLAAPSLVPGMFGSAASWQTECHSSASYHRGSSGLDITQEMRRISDRDLHGIRLG